MGVENEIRIPDIGDFEDVEVIEILVSVGDSVSAEDSLITVESEKASMEIPSPCAGVVGEIKVALGDRVREGTLILVIASDDGASVASREPAARSTPAVATEHAAAASATPDVQPVRDVAASAAAAPPAIAAPLASRPAGTAHASPSVRRFARQLGADLSGISGTGRKGRILKDDVQNHVRQVLARGAAAALPIDVLRVEPARRADFARFGAIEIQPLHKIRRAAARSLHRSWVTIPHVTQFDEADITELEAYRAAQKTEADKRGVKLTALAFLMKAVVVALKQYPQFCASLDDAGENLVLKQYYHLGVAVDTPNGLVVPVIRDVDRKGLYELAGELAATSERARTGKLTPLDLSGGCFSISSLGGIGGTAFTPIVNGPEVAILGVSRHVRRPVWIDEKWAARLMLPLSLSYDHRVIDGADAARFTSKLCDVLSDVRNLVL